MPKQFKIIHEWEHVQGHIVSQDFYKNQFINADDENSAIESFILIKPELGQYVKNIDGKWRYGIYSGRYHNIVKAVAV